MKDARVLKNGDWVLENLFNLSKHLESGEALHPSLEMGFNLEAMAILDAGVRSSASRKLKALDNPVWRIG